MKKIMADTGKCWLRDGCPGKTAACGDCKPTDVGCPVYRWFKNLLMKEQKKGETFVVIDTKTGKEADTYNIALHEDWAKQLCYCDMDGWAIGDDGALLLVDECGRFAYADRERFKVKWNESDDNA